MERSGTRVYDAVATAVLAWQTMQSLAFLS